MIFIARPAGRTAPTVRHNAGLGNVSGFQTCHLIIVAAIQDSNHSEFAIIKNKSGLREKVERKKMATVNNIRRMANVMHQYAEELDRVAVNIERTGDITYAAEAATTVVNCLINLRIDLLVSQPIRELKKGRNK